MQDKSSKPDATRRLLLFSGAALSGLAVVKLQDTLTAPQVVEEVDPSRPNLDSDHIRTFYKLNRF